MPTSGRATGSNAPLQAVCPREPALSTAHLQDRTRNGRRPVAARAGGQGRGSRDQRAGTPGGPTSGRDAWADPRQGRGPDQNFGPGKRRQGVVHARERVPATASIARPIAWRAGGTGETARDAVWRSRLPRPGHAILSWQALRSLQSGGARGDAGDPGNAPPAQPDRPAGPAPGRPAGRPAARRPESERATRRRRCRRVAGAWQRPDAKQLGAGTSDGRTSGARPIAPPAPRRRGTGRGSIRGVGPRGA
jgi:hypothetical protein